MAIFKIMKQVEDRIPSPHNRPAKNVKAEGQQHFTMVYTYPTPASPLHRQDSAAPTTNGTSRRKKLTCAPLAYPHVTATLPVPLHIQ